MSHNDLENYEVLCEFTNHSVGNAGVWQLVESDEGGFFVCIPDVADNQPVTIAVSGYDAMKILVLAS